MNETKQVNNQINPSNSKSTNLLQHPILKNSCTFPQKISKSMLSPNQTPQIVVINNYYSAGGNTEQKKEGNSIQDKKVIDDGCKMKIRVDVNGNEIKKKGKHKVSFIDKVSKHRFVHVVEIESFKEFNKEEEELYVNKNHSNSCCGVF